MSDIAEEFAINCKPIMPAKFFPAWGKESDFGYAALTAIVAAR
jgi:hypothetical protein